MAQEAVPALGAHAKHPTYIAGLMAALDALEDTDDRAACAAAADALEAHILSLPARTADELLWKARRMVRAVEHGWSDCFAVPLAASLAADLEAITTGR